MDIIRVFGRLGLPRAPFWAQAAAVCAVCAVVGVLALGDYGVGRGEPTQREIAIVNADYIATGDISGLSQPKDVAYRYYGIVFDMSLLLVERTFGLQDSRDIYLARHLIIHLFFIAGGFACGMLAYRMVGSRWVALLAMLMFLLHPRIYAHSFFNVKDIPFAALLLIALYLARHAFRKDTLGAFLLCGVVVGLAIDLRPFGLMLMPMILAMRVLDMWQASREERKRILVTGAMFMAAALATAYIIHPYYWENPLRFVEGLRVVSQHPNIFPNLFMGEIHDSNAVPWSYIPVWFAITAPPVALALGALGAAVVCWQVITRPLAALRDREIRFRILALGCFVMPIVVVIALQSNIYDGWRQMYFLWGPFCLLAAVGLRAIASANVGKGVWKVGERLPCWVRGGALRRALAYGVVGAGLITTLTAMAALHPYEYVYFNGLTDTRTPGALAKRYDMDYWHMTQRQSLERLLALYPDDALRVYPDIRSARILPQNDRERIAVSPQRNADFYLYWSFHRRGDALWQPEFHTIEAYGSVIAYILAPNSDVYRDYYRAEYGDAAANGTLFARSDFDIYAHNGALYYLKEDCEPLPPQAPNFRLFLHIFPVDSADLPSDRREFGFESRHFRLADNFGFFGGKCVRHSLPDYPIARIRTGQDLAGEIVWRADIDLAAHAAAQALYEDIAAGDYGQPAAQSDFDVYLRGDGLAYLKENCAAGDTDARFFLHIFPADPADLPADWREYGFENLDFRFGDHGAYAGDKCVAERELPGYAIERIRTGQFVSGERHLWGVEFPVGR